MAHNEQSRLGGRLLNASVWASILLRSLFACVRVHVAFVAPVVGLGTVRVGRMMGRNVGTVLGGVSADGMAAALGHDGHSEYGQGQDTGKQ